VPRLLSADDIIPLVASLTDRERTRLLRWIAAPHGADATAYEAAPPTPNEFDPGDEPLAWDADGWDDLARNAATCDQWSGALGLYFKTADSATKRYAQISSAGAEQPLCLQHRAEMPNSLLVIADHIPVANLTDSQNSE